MNVYEVKRSELELQDLPVSLDSLTGLEDASVFEFNQKAARPYEYDANFISGIDIQGNIDLTYLKRDGYTILDVLSDIGGVSAALITPVLVILSIVNYNHLESYMASKLYHVEQEQPSFNETQTYTPTKCGNIGEYMIDTLPSCLVCCKKSQQQRRIQRARESLEQEMDILELVKTVRFFKMAVKMLLSS